MAAAFLALVILLVALIVSVLEKQAFPFIADLPAQIRRVSSQQWFPELNGRLGGTLTAALQWVQLTATNPTVWVAVGGGVSQLGVGIVGVAFSLVFVVALTLYLVVGLPSIKSRLYSLMPVSRRSQTIAVSGEIADNVGKYLGGMSVLAALNASFTFVSLTVLGGP